MYRPGGSFAKGVTLINYASPYGRKRERKSPFLDSNYLSHLTTNPYNPIRRLNGRYIFLCVFIYLSNIVLLNIIYLKTHNKRRMKKN